MFSLTKKSWKIGLFVMFSLGLTACSTSTSPQQAQKSEVIPSKVIEQGHIQLSDPERILSRLTQRQQEWKGTRYRLGGYSKKGIDCSGFTQLTFKELFGIKLPRTTADQAMMGSKVSKSELQAGDLVFFKTGRGPNGKHVGIYLEGGKFLHASTKGGVIYSNLSSPYWSKAYWQSRRL